MDCSTPALPVHHQLPEFTQTRCVGDPIQPSHPLSSDIQDSKCYVKTFLSIVIIPQNFKVLLKVLQLLKLLNNSNSWNIPGSSHCPTLIPTPLPPTPCPMATPGFSSQASESLQPHQHNPKYSLVQSFSHVRLFVTPWTAALQASLSITNSQSLLKLIVSVMPSNHLILCRWTCRTPNIIPKPFFPL